MDTQAAVEESLPFYLQGNFAPVDEERTEVALRVTGAIPPELRGLYLRNGPNPRGGKDPGHWFFGDGMLHGVRLEDGRAAWYRNRWVRTRVFEEGAQIIDENGNVDRTVAHANTSVVGHAGRIFALVETSFPTEIGRELETLGTRNFDGRLTTGMTAHPKICPTTGELHFFGYGFFPPFLTYHRLSPDGVLVQSEKIPVKGPTMIHDFAITDRHVIFMDLPVVFDLEAAMASLGDGSGGGGGMPYHWNDDYGARLGLMPRGGSGADVRWFEIEPCYVFHPLNAWEEDGKVVLVVARYPQLWREGTNQFDPAFLHRYTIDPASGRVAEERLDDLPIEFPRVDPRREGLSSRYGYAVANAANVGDTAWSIAKYDFRTGGRADHVFDEGQSPSEAVFVPASSTAGDDAGWLLAYVYDAARNASDLVVLDAAGMGAEPVARVHLPVRVPFGFHGNWIPDPA